MKKYRLSFLIKPITYLLDIGTLNIAFVTAYFITFGHLNNIFETPYLLLFWFINVSWFAIIAIFKPFNDSRISFNIPTLLFNYAKIVLLLLAIVSLFWVSFKVYYYSRMVLFATILIAGFLGVIWRILGVYFFRAYRQMGYNNRNFAVVGGGDLAKHITQYFVAQPELGFRFIGTYDEPEPDQTKTTTKQSLEELNALCFQNEVDTIYLCTPYLKAETIANYITLAEQLPLQIKLITDFRGFLQKGVSVEYHGYIPVINVAKNPYANHKIEIVKRSFDISFSLLFLIFASPILVVVCLVTRLSSKGPAFYTQERIGRWGKPFDIIKFRSMYIDAEKAGPVLSSGSNDTRITPWGKFMRKTRLDELPQFVNVLLGDMSIVGPRPERQFFIDKIKEYAPEYVRLLSVRPGITSLGQIYYGYASNVDEMLSRMKYDLLYLKKYSFETDLWLIILTAKVMIQGKGK
jgi:putative colanic acid biosynthesis UDP-glucose lipid carrier transferase